MLGYKVDAPGAPVIFLLALSACIPALPTEQDTACMDGFAFSGGNCYPVDTADTADTGAIMDTEAEVATVKSMGRIDADGDGLYQGVDCDDADPAVHEDSEVLDCDADGIPPADDCDNTDASVGVASWYPDADNDGTGDASAMPGCEGDVQENSDCWDGGSSVPDNGWHEDPYQGNRWDYNCDGTVETRYPHGAGGDIDGWADGTPPECGVTEDYMVDMDNGIGNRRSYTQACR